MDSAQAPPEVQADREPSGAQLLRAQAKPPLYRFFRGGMYVAYMVAVLWLIGSITTAAWQAVWGEAGRKMQADELAQHPLAATPKTP